MQNPFGGQTRLKLRRDVGGYTILEVMLFIAISGLLLVSAFIMVGNRQASTEFSTGMNDINSKMRQWVNQVVNGFSGSTFGSDPLTNYGCTLGTDDYPELSTDNPQERGMNPLCVFLGKAIQLSVEEDNNNNMMYAYTVLGRRTYSDGGQQALVDTLSNARPTAAVFLPDIDLTEEYRLPNGIRVKSVNTDNAPPGADQSRMAGFFSSFAGGSIGARSIMAVQYPMSTDNPPRSNAVLGCIKLSVDPCDNGVVANPNPYPMGEWRICFQSTRNNDTATLHVISTEGRGFATRLDFSPC